MKQHITEKDNLIRYYHKFYINIALYGMSWDGLWGREKRFPSLRDIINRVKLLEKDWFFSKYLPYITGD